MQIAVYTAVYGGYDELKAPVEQDVPCDFFCFTDGDLPKRVGSWRIVHTPADPRVHPRMAAKRLKLLSHEVFRSGSLSWGNAIRAGVFPVRPRYDVTIWIDGSMRVTGHDFARTVANLVERDCLALFAHPDRDCVFEEAEVSASMVKYQGLPVVDQVAHYRKQGLRPHSGLYACGVIGRPTRNCDQVFSVNRRWWQENLAWTYQDQLSLPFVLMESEANINVIPGDLWDNRWFELVGHRSRL